MVNMGRVEFAVPSGSFPSLDLSREPIIAQRISALAGEGWRRPSQVLQAASESREMRLTPQTFRAYISPNHCGIYPSEVARAACGADYTQRRVEVLSHLRPLCFGVRNPIQRCEQNSQTNKKPVESVIDSTGLIYVQNLVPSRVLYRNSQFFFQQFRKCET